MAVWVVIPVKPPGQAKSRLSEVLGEAQREALAEAMLAHVFDAASKAGNVAHVALLGPSRLGLPDSVRLLDDPGDGLNAAIASAFQQVAALGADRMVVLFADLPRLEAADVERLACPAQSSAAIAPDRHGTGTNALSLPIPDAGGFTFAFGPDSFARHKAEIDRMGLRIEEVHSPGLAHDVDVPEDLVDAAGLAGTKK